GVKTTNHDQDILRITNLIRNTTDPRLTNIQARGFAGFPEGPVIFLRIPNSWNKPHMVTTNGRFYARTASGKYPMDTDELRDSFLQTHEITTRIRAFRDRRVAEVTAGNTPVPIAAGPAVILHLVPLQAMRPSNEVDIKGLEAKA